MRVFLLLYLQLLKVIPKIIVLELNKMRHKAHKIEEKFYVQRYLSGKF